MARAVAATTEAGLQSVLMEACAWAGWLAHHETDSRRTAPGWPDLVAVDATSGRCLAVELKSARGRLTAAQTAWVAGWAAVSAAAGSDVVRAGVVRPSELDRVLSWIAASAWRSLSASERLPVA